MPIYEFACQRCGTEFEQILAFSDATVPGCPSCQSSVVERKLGRPSIHFKGSGWYVTDSKKTAKGSADGDSESGAAKATRGDSDTDDSAAEKTTKDAGDKAETTASKSGSAKETQAGRDASGRDA